MASSLTPIGPQALGSAPASQVPGPLAETGAGLAPHEGGQSGAALARLVQSFKRYKWLIIALTLIGLGGGFVATRYISPSYTVGATIWIETPTNDRTGGPIQGDRLLGSRAWVDLLTTYVVLDPVVRERKLYLSAARGPDSVLFRNFALGERFLPGPYELKIDPDGKRWELKHGKLLVTDNGAVGDSVGRRVGLLWVPRPPRASYGRTVQFTVKTPREASEHLVERLTTDLREETFLRIGLSETNPVEAAATLNALIKRYVDEAATQKRQKLTLLASVLDSQVVEQAEKLRVAEEGLEAYRVRTITLPREDQPQVATGLSLTQPTVYTQYFTIRQARDDLRRDRRAIEEVLAKVRAGTVAVDAFNTIPTVRSAPDLQRVLLELSTLEADLRVKLQRYTEEFREVKDVRERIATLRDKTIPMYAEALVSRLTDQEQELSTQIASYERDMREIPTRAQTESRLRRQFDQADALYRNLESSRQQARLAEASAIPDVRILDSAEVPTSPNRNSTASLILIGLGAGLGLGLALAFLLDRVDRRVRYPEQISHDMGLAILGTIPQVRHHSGSPDDVAQVIESFRSVRLNLMHCYQPGTTISLAISSPSPGDGKSLISSNLALSFAESGLRTLLIDGDIRRGDLHRTFGLERRPGLLDYLGGEADHTEILRPATHPQLMVIPCGTRRRQGPELLGSARMHDLMNMLRGRYEVIIVDTPPLGAGIDPFVLATATGHLALVLRAGETDRQLAEAKLQMLDRLPVRLLGAILNDVRVGEGAYKYYAYTYGPTADEETAPAALAPAVK